MNTSRNRIILVLLCLITAVMLIPRGEKAAGSGMVKPESAVDNANVPLDRVEVPVASESAAVAFDRWAARFVSATAEEKRALLDQGITLASARRTELKGLIATNPQRALAVAIPPALRQQMPRAIVERLEERVNEAAFFGVLGALPGAGSEVGPAIRRHVRTDDGGNYRAFVFGRRNTQQTTERASIVGIAVDDFLAVDESPLRVVAAGEIPNHPANLTQRRRVTEKDEAGFSADSTLREQSAAKPLVDVCPISGIESPLPENSAPISPEQPVIEAEGKFQFLCSGGHIHAYRDSLVAREGANGGPAKPSNLPTATQSTGFKSNLLMRVAFPELRKESVSEKEGYQLGKDVEDWFVDSSFGKLTFITTVTPILILPRTEAWYKNADTSGSSYEVLTDARVAAKTAGFDPANFDFDTVIYTGSPGSFSGQAYVGSKGCWLKSGTGVGVACHEYGHNFGLWHANSWNTSGASIIGNGAHVEYGDNFDTMGSASAGDLQFNACHKNLLGWIPDASIHNVKASGAYRIYQMDQARQDPANRYAIKIRKDSDRDYWVDLRQRSLSSNRWVAGGVFLHWSPWAPSAGGSHLLDTTPGSPDDKIDAPIVIGRTFSDTETGIHITPVAKNASSPPSFDVVVNIGTFPGNQAPVLSIAADQLAVNTNATVTFTATASDADGDPLSYWWDFGDKNFATTNTAATTKSWPAAGDYVVRCVASDMKGGTASRAVVVRVGSPAVFSVTGTITLNGQPLPDVRVHNGLTTSSYRGSFTNSDGTFVIAGLNAGTYTIGASLYGYTFAPTTVASVTVGPDAAVDFTATETPRLSITAVTPTVAEGASGTLRLSRTGSTTSALAVNMLLPGGFASKGSDYTLTPDLTSGTPFYTVSIPAGQSDLNIAFAAQNDTGQEGPENAVFEVVPGSNYVITNSSATITIDDPDTTKPLVRLITVDNDASEDGGTGTFVIERFGSTSAALSVTVAMTGAAANGTDYQNIPTTVSILAGQSQAVVTLTPIADTAIEGPETATLTISTASAYIRAPSSADYAGTVTITDAQTPVVSIVASDATASEAGSDPGIFVITRTGSTAQSLVVQLGLTGSALQGVDYATIPAQVTIPAGSDFTTVVITPIDDGIGEPAQTVRLYLRANSNYAIGAAGDATVTITDNSDVPYVTVGTTASAKESGTNGTFKITTQGTGSGSIIVNYTLSGTSTNGTDFTTLPGTLSIGKNTTSTITVIPTQDTENEGYESVTLTLTPDAAYTLALDSSATLNIEDDELPQINVSTTDDAFSENTGNTAKFFVSRTGATTAALVVNYAMSGTATADVDYTAPSGTVTIPAAGTGAYVDIAILGDSLLEGTETITLNVTPDATYNVGFGSATYDLDDAETPTLSLRFNPNTATVAENIGTATATMTLSAASANTVTVQTVLNGGTALGGGIDYTLASEVVEFAPGETSKVINIPISDDTLPEPNETIILTLDNPTNARLSSTAANTIFTITITITDNDAAPPATVGFTSTTGSGVESLTTAPIFVTLSGPQAGVVAVDYAVTGGTATAADHTITAGTMTFAAGETAKRIPNSIIDDGDQESSETIILTLSNPTGVALNANATHTYTITDNDSQTLSISATVSNASEPGTNGLFTITRAGATGSATTVNLVISGTATAGLDYDAIPATVTLDAGATTVTVPVTVLDDTTGEGTETVIVTLAAGPYGIGSPSSATVTIADDEPTITIGASDSAASEAGTDPGTIVITRTGITAASLTLDATISGSASAPSDYAAFASPIVIPAGSSSLTLTVIPVDDPAPEGSETVVVTLNVAPGYLISGPASATVTIADDDVNSPPSVTINSPTLGTATLPPGVGLILEATVNDDGKPFGGVLTTTWSMVSGPGIVTFGDAAQPDTTATFSTAGTYLLRLSANDSGLTTNADLNITVLQAEQAWAGTNIASATPAGSFTEVDGTFTIKGGGSNISGTADTFYFVQHQLVGNCDFRARIVSMTGGAGSAKAGVMIRQSTAGNSRGAFMSAYGTGATSGSWRTRLTDGASWATVNGTGGPSFPRWVRVVRNGSSYSGFTSNDGASWTAVGSAGTVSMTEPLLIGLAVTSNNTSALCTAVFDNVSILQTSNVAPFVSAGPDGSTVLPQPAALGGNASDDGLPGALTTTWSKRSGPGTVSFADAAAEATTAGFSAPGTYVLRLVADDAQVKTFDEVTITTSVPMVNITANSPGATEANDGVAAYTITRTGSGDSTMAVQFTVGGTTSVADYTSTTLGNGGLSIPIGSTSAVVSAAIVKDALIEGTETLSLTLDAGSSYTIGVNSSATVNIIDAPVLSITATDPVATELSLTAGMFTVTRSGPTDSALPFTTNTSGTATAGTDYVNAGTSFVIPAGQAELAIPLSPLADALPEGSETATLTLVETSEFALGTASANVVIADLPADDWRLAKFGAEAGNSAIAGDLADPDGDGIVNLLEYAFSHEPLAFEAPPSFDLGTGELSLTYRFNLLAPDLTYVVQKSTDAANWQPALPVNEIVSDDGTVRVIRAHVLVGGEPAAFLRLQVTRP